MGCWGMGITQSDEFCEVYDRFLEEYDQGRAVAEIREGLLLEYLGECDEEDGVLHDVYFAIAKAEWMCAEQSKAILDKVRYIIDNDLNITFYRELGATKSDLQLRCKNFGRHCKCHAECQGKGIHRKSNNHPHYPRGLFFGIV